MKTNSLVYLEKDYIFSLSLDPPKKNQLYCEKNVWYIKLIAYFWVVWFFFLVSKNAQ